MQCKPYTQSVLELSEIAFFGLAPDLRRTIHQGLQKEHQVSKTREMMVHQSAAKTSTLRRVARARQPA